MAFGMQVIDRNGLTTLDTGDSTWMQVAFLSIGKGDSPATVTFNGGSLPTGMVLKAALQVLSDIPTAEKQLVPSVSINTSTRVVTVTTTSGTTTDSEQRTFPAYSAACSILILGR